MPPLRAHDLDDRVVVVAPSRVHRHACRLVDHDHIIVLVHDTYWLSGHRRLVPVERDFLAIDDNIATLDGVFLEHISPSTTDRQGGREKAYVIFLRPISELSREDIEELSPAPTLFAVGVVGEVVRTYFAQPILEIVRPRPWI
ncbi:MAG: hypothetical protein Q9184_003283 [Pyrenodesmia sp. 2 TL-2023]